MTREALMEFLGKPVRLTSTSGVVTEGRMVAYCDSPTVQIDCGEHGQVSLATSIIASASPVPCSYCAGTGVHP